MNLSNNNDKKSKKSGIASLFGGRGSVSKIGKSQFPKSMGGIMERLKGLSRKDLAMVGIGLSVLVAAPVAEYMMSKPADSANMLTSGFSSRDAQGTSALASLYEPGINALSQGSADGSGEVITPLSARDPSTLILGANPEQPPMPDFSSVASSGMDSSSGTTTPPDYNDMRDSVKDSAKRGAVKAMGDAGPRTQITRMQGAFTGGFGVIKSGGSTRTDGSAGSKGLSAPSKANVGVKQSTMVKPVASAGYKGAASTPNSADSSAADKLRAKAAVQGGYFSGASATKAADSAYGVKMNEKLGDASGSGFGGTGYGGGAAHQGFKNSNVNGHYKPFSNCTTLACKAAETRQQHALQWEKYLKYDLPQKFIEAGVKGLTGLIDKTAQNLTKMIWNEDIDGITEYYCLKLKQGAKGPLDMLHPCDAEVANKTKSFKTRDSWKDCAIIVTSSEFDKYFRSKCGGGESNPGGNTPATTTTPKPNNDSNTASKPNGSSADTIWNKKPDGRFEEYVTNYDKGLKKFMAEMAEVIKKSESPDGVDYARKSVHTYASLSEGDGFGFSFNNLNSFINAGEKSVVSLRKKEIKNNNTTIKNTRDALAKEQAAGSVFLNKLKEIKDHPEDYQKGVQINGFEAATHLSDAIKSQINKYYNEYKSRYDSMLTETNGFKPYVTRLTEYEIANIILEKYTEESGKVNANVYRNYSGEYISKVNSYISNSDQWKQDPKKNIAEFTNKMYGAAMFAKLSSADYESMLAKETPYAYGRILSSMSNETPKDIQANSPAGKARSWRGFPSSFGTDIKNVSTGSKDLETRYVEQSKKTILDEEQKWNSDCPLEIKDGKLGEPKEGIKNLKDAQSKMSKDQFYAPAYRLVYEIGPALAKINGSVGSINKNISDTSDKREEIIKYLAAINIPIEGQNNNSGKQTCVDTNSCTSANRKAAEQNASTNHKYDSVKNNYDTETSQLVGEIWSDKWLYKDLGSGWKESPEYSNQAVKAHNLRLELESQAQRLSATNDSKERDNIKKEIASTKLELQRTINSVNAEWQSECKNHYDPKYYKSRCSVPLFNDSSSSGNNAVNNGSTGSTGTAGNNGTNDTASNNGGGMPMPSVAPVINPPGAQINPPGAQINPSPAPQINPDIITRSGNPMISESQNSGKKVNESANTRASDSENTSPKKLTFTSPSFTTNNNTYSVASLVLNKSAKKVGSYVAENIVIKDNSNSEILVRRIVIRCNNGKITGAIAYMPGGLFPIPEASGYDCADQQGVTLKQGSVKSATN